jgi:hypothetical protein
MDDAHKIIIPTRLPAATSHSSGYDWWTGAAFYPFGHRFIELRGKEREQEFTELASAVSFAFNDSVSTAVAVEKI